MRPRPTDRAAAPRGQKTGMKVCILCSDHAPSDPRVFHKEARTLVRAGYEVTLICPSEKGTGWVDGVQVRGFPRTRSLLLRPLNWWRILSLLRDEPADLYHFHDPDLLFVGLLLSKLTRRPVIYDCHEHYAGAIMSDVRIPSAGRGLLARLYGFVESGIAAQLAAVIVASIDENGERRFHRARNLTLIRNFPWVEMFQAPPAALERKPQLLYLGQINESHRHVSILLEMLALLRHKDVSLLLVGPTDREETRERLETLVRDRGLGERVQFVGRVPYETVRTYMSESLIGLLPLRPVPRWDADIPTKMFEYMASELPFVVSDLPQPRRFVQESGAGVLVEPESAQAFADAVDHLLEHPDEARRMGQLGRAAFLRDYTWDRESRKLLDLYERLLHREGRPTRRETTRRR